MINVLTNAEKYTTHGQIVIEATLQSLSELEIKVKDTGKGIPKQKLSELCEIYGNKIDNVDQMETSSGMGLAVCKKILQNMGGSIEIDSEEGVSTEVTILVPISIAPKDQSVVDDCSPALSIPSYSYESASMRGMRK